MTKALVSALMFSTIAYTLLIGTMVWFTFAFFGFGAKGDDVVGMIGFCLFGLSPLPVCIYCFRRVRALLNGDRPKSDGGMLTHSPYGRKLPSCGQSG